MANIYVDSTDGSDSDSGATWALAKATLAGATAIDAAGDNIYVASTHNESSASTITLTIAASASNPVKILGVSDAAEPPTAFATGASVTTTGAANIVLNGSCYFKNISFTAGGTISYNGTGGVQIFENCDFKTTNTGSGGGFQGIAANVLTRTVFKDCTFYFTAASNHFTVLNSTEIKGGSIKTGSTTLTSFIRFAGDRTGGDLLVESFDLTNFSNTVHLVNSSSVGSGKIVFRNCKLPASWSGNLVSSTFSSPGLRVSMHNCDSADTNYRMWIEDYAGSIKSETTLIRTGGASDGTTGISWKVATTSSANEYTATLETEEIYIWNDTVGSAITLTIDILHDSATNLKDNEVWLEAQALTTSGVPFGTIYTDRRADIFATAVDQASSSATWTTTGMTNPNKQKLSVTLTPQEKGYIILKVCSAKPSHTFYVDPKVQVS